MTSGSISETATTCPYCGVGCGVLVKPSADGMRADVRGDPDHPSNFGRLCSKGSALGETLGLEDRILYPTVGGLIASWEEAMDEVARGFRDAIRQHGPDSVAFYVSGQILTEDYYVANKLMKGFIGSSNIDTNSRLCMASSVAGHKRAFGTDTVPGCYEDLEEADLIVMVGSNLAWCHPVLFQRIQSAREKRGTKLVIIDPRQTATTESADLHLPIKPGMDVQLFNALFQYLAASRARDDRFVSDHTNGLKEALMAAGAYDLKTLAINTGLGMSDLSRFFSWFEETSRTVTVYSQGVNQASTGTDKVNAIINCHLITGRIGKPGCGPFSVTGQPNAMGGREVGGLANQLAAHMDFDAADVDRVRRFWDAPNIATGPGMKAVEMFDAVADGRIKAIWIMATNPVVSLPDADKVKAALEACPMVVVSDVVTTSDTVKFADIVLPATTWGEKSGTVTNSERRISRQRSFLNAPGEARHDWWALCELAKRLGFSGFDYASPAGIYREYARLSDFENDDTRDFNIGAHVMISASEYDALSPFQWPLSKACVRPDDVQAGRQHRFFAYGQFYTPDRKARFIATPFREPASKPNAKHPYVLNTGRIRDHWHTMTRTGKSIRLTGHIAEPFLEVHPADAAKLGLEATTLAEVQNQYGRALLRVLVTDRVTEGSVFAPMHWSDANSAKGRVDALVAPNTDPISGQPESKHAVVAIKPFDPDWYGFAVSREPLTDIYLSGLDYWASARVAGGWRYELAGPGDVKAALQALNTSEAGLTLMAASDLGACAIIENDQLQRFASLSARGPVEADRTWLASLLGEALSTEIRLSILAGRPPLGTSAGRTICSCLGVGSSAIEEAVMAGASSVEGVGAATGAGTNCGSCKPEIRAILEAARPRPDDISIAAE